MNDVVEACVIIQNMSFNEVCSHYTGKKNIIIEEEDLRLPIDFGFFESRECMCEQAAIQ